MAEDEKKSLLDKAVHAGERVWSNWEQKQHV